MKRPFIIFGIITLLYDIMILYVTIYALSTYQFNIRILIGLLIAVALSYLLFIAIKKSVKDSRNKVVNSVNVDKESLKYSETASKETLYKSLPKTIGGNPLKYQYNIVRLYTPDDLNFNYEQIKIGKKVELVKEPSNPYDNKAIAIYCDSIKIGYLHKGKLQDMSNDFIDCGDKIFAYIDSIANKDIAITLGFYKEPFYADEVKIKLVKNTSEEYQDNIMCISKDELVDIEYDYEKNAYAVKSGYTIGFIPQGKESLFNRIEQYKAFVSDIDLNDNDKYVVTITVKY